MLTPHLQGMLLGNCITGVSIGLARVMEEVTRGASSFTLHVHIAVIPQQQGMPCCWQANFLAS